MAEAVRRGEDPKSLCIAQRLAATEEKSLGVDTAMLEIVEDKILIAKIMKKKRRWIDIVCPNYVEKKES